MWTHDVRPQITSLAPQFLVDDLARSIAFYEKLGFVFDEPWQGFYAIGCLDMIEIHLKEAPKNDSERQHRRANDHLDAAAGVNGVELFFRQCVDRGVPIVKPLAPTPWGTLDFYVEDPDGYIISFGGQRGLPDAERDQVLEALRRDVAATLGPGHDQVVTYSALLRALNNDNLHSYRDRVVEEVQQHFHDSFIDTVWPPCPHHPNHPLWLDGEHWCCRQSGIKVAKLGELRRSGR